MRVESQGKGILAWFAQNTVAANLIMFIIMVGGFVFMGAAKQEVFPEVNLNWVWVGVPYPGASPQEVEQGIILSIEEALAEVDGIKKMVASANEGMGSVSVQLHDSTDETKALNEIKSVVDRITSFPKDSERPVTSLLSNRRQVISLPIYGDVDRKLLKALAEKVRDDLVGHPEISIAQISGLPSPEIAIEIPQEKMRSLGLTYQQVANSISAASVEIPGGGIKTKAGEILVRLSKRRDEGDDFRDIVVLARPDGSIVRLGEIANIKDGFSESDRSSLFNGKPAVTVDIFRVGDQTPIAIADIANQYVIDLNKTLPEGVAITTWADTSEMYRGRIDLLLRNSGMGLILVLIILGLFLEIRLAFWATFGIPIAFLGAFVAMYLITGISINMISLFGFLLALGIVVDDAIVVGESIYHERDKQPNFVQAAIVGVQKVSIPVVFAVATTIVAFIPMLTIPGVSGKFFQNIPGVVIPILFISLFEVFVILPAHLAHANKDLPKIFRPIQRVQEYIAKGLENWIDKFYVPFVNIAVQNRYISLAVSFGILILTIGYIASGRIQFTFMPKIESDQVVAIVELPFGTPAAQTRLIVKRISDAAELVFEDVGGSKYGRGISSDIGKAGGNDGGVFAGFASRGSHVGQAAIRLVSSELRPFTAAEFTDKWREKVGEIAGIEKLTFSFSSGPPVGMPIDLRISHRDKDMLERAGERIAEELRNYQGVLDIDDGSRLGKEQLDLELTPAGIALGLTELDLARQVRSAFFGSEALRQQRGRDEIRVYVRRPLADRQSEFDIESLMVRTPRGGDIPLRVAANIKRGRSFTKIRREEGRRVVNVTADVEENVSAGTVLEGFENDVMPKVMADFPGLSWEKAGSQQEQAETMKALGIGMGIALLVIFALLAVAFKSYVQPIVIMVAIPFGLVGAIVGHIVLGYGLSVISMMGLIALTGVVVNDSLVLIDAVNGFRSQGHSAHQAVILGGARRFRPILLTSLTTFFGLAPMILETSVQARFLVPMAISLGFGVLFVTAIALIIVPTAYMAVEDLRVFFGFETRSKTGL